MTQAGSHVIERAQALPPWLCEDPKPEPPVVPTPGDPLPPEPEPTEPQPDILPVPKLPDERARDLMQEMAYVEPQ